MKNANEESTSPELKEMEEGNGKTKLRKLLNQNFKIEMTDGRVLIGVFLCTDRDANVILGACSEYLKNPDGETEEPRVLGLVMVPGRHIVSIQLDEGCSRWKREKEQAKKLGPMNWRAVEAE